ncbi:hypothetical protein J0673_24705, partial [Vibrio sp. Vb2736]|uniref:hypothetical protein n=1 Tax=Vibrio sp. Vb2736 TaxID=2816075 RepID=UPI001A8E9158
PNVDLLIQSCQCELDPADTHADYLPNGTQLQQWLASYLQSQGWPKATSMAQSIVGAYAQHLKTSVELAFESWIADLGVTCGNDAL